MKITKNINRLSLHDAHFEKEVRYDNTIEITFDWAKFENLVENGVEEPVIMGETRLTICGVTDEKLTAIYEGGNTKVIDFPENIGQYWSEVAQTKIDEFRKTLLLDGLFTKGGESYWVEWSLKYEKCEVEWNSYIRMSEWKGGKLPLDRVK